MNTTMLRSASLALAFAASAFGCSDATSAPESASSMNAAMGALKSAVATCAEEREACESAADAGAASCAETFDTCKDEALEAAMPELDKGVKVCAEESRTCRKGADTNDDKRACTDALKSCVDESRADEDSVDASAKEEHASPVAVCTDALRTCIEGDAEAKTCTDALRSCLATTLPNFANGYDRRDGGKADAGHGKSDEHKPLDAGAGKPDRADAGASDSCDAAFEGCLAAGTAAKECARERVTCRDAR